MEKEHAYALDAANYAESLKFPIHGPYKFNLKDYLNYSRHAREVHANFVSEFTSLIEQAKATGNRDASVLNAEEIINTLNSDITYKFYCENAFQINSQPFLFERFKCKLERGEPLSLEPIVNPNYLRSHRSLQP